MFMVSRKHFLTKNQNSFILKSSVGFSVGMQLVINICEVLTDNGMQKGFEWKMAQEQYKVPTHHNWFHFSLNMQQR